MALIKPKKRVKKIAARITLPETLLNEAKEYCQWAGIDKVDDFIEQAMELVFSKDKDWKSSQKIDTL